ncbi:MAG: PD40 domain-containing protein [Anaerolineales bacterium]|nr:PD40 domain-containing protein [Anaerolineales bacterium]
MATVVDVYENPTALQRFTPVPIFTPIRQTQSPLATIIALSTSTSNSNQPFSIDRIRQVYVKGGNIYLINGLNLPRQLTHSGRDRDPIFSDDGEKIVFYRGEDDNDVYSINADGSNEQLIIKSKSLPTLAQGDIKALTFVPKTHLLLFNTYLCNPSPQGPSYNAPECTVGLYRVDTDSGEISIIVGGLTGNTMQERNFEISPDGTFISVSSSGHIDIYAGNRIIYPDAVHYYRTPPDEYLPQQYWLPDSSGLIAVVAADQESNEPATPPSTYSVLRYTIKDNQVVQIPFELPIIFNSGCNFSVSPDTNWIFYISDGNGQGVGTPSLYIGNLNNGSTQLFDWDGRCPSSYYSDPQWSPDSKYFASQKTIWSVEGSSISIGGDFIAWIDSNHYLYTIYDANIPKTSTFIGEIGGDTISLPEDFIWSSEFIILDPKNTP